MSDPQYIEVIEFIEKVFSKVVLPIKYSVFFYGSEYNCIRRAFYVVQRWSAISLILWLLLGWAVDKMVHQELFFDGYGACCGTSWKWISLSHWIWTTSIRPWQFRQSFCYCERRRSRGGAGRGLMQKTAPPRNRAVIPISSRTSRRNVTRSQTSAFIHVKQRIR